MTRSSMRADARSSWPRYGADLLRGALIGTAETVPGVSGGTVALVVRVYDTAITSAGHVLAGVLRTCTDLPAGRGRARAAGEFRAVNWRVVVPLLVGMFTALVLMARLLEGWVENQPVQSRALFFGLVLASLWVPFSLAVEAPRANRTDAGWAWRDTVVALLVAALAYSVVGMPVRDVSPTPLVVVLAAAVAVSALVLPGLSGSFLLLTFGLYEPTLSAVNERDIGYLALFALGALIGLASIVKLLQWLLTHRRHATLVILTGLMAGSLRALWPWQSPERDLLAPGAHLGVAVVLALLGFGVVVAVLLIERGVAHRQGAGPETGNSEHPRQQ